MSNNQILNPSSIHVVANNPVETNNHPISNVKSESSRTTMSAESVDISEYMVWSTVNLFVGAIILGIPSIILSKLTRRFKRQDNLKVSKILSTITLAYNIFVSIAALIGLVFLVTYYTSPF